MQIQEHCQKTVTHDENQIQIGGIYEHYKGMRYKVLMLVWASETDELERWVVYQALYDTPDLGEKPVFARSLARFLEKTTVNGQMVDRFSYIEPAE